MIQYWGTIVLPTSFHDWEGPGHPIIREGLDLRDRILSELIEEDFRTVHSAVQNGEVVIHFSDFGNHDGQGRMRRLVQGLFEELERLGPEVTAFFSALDDEANDGKGGHFEYRVNYPPDPNR